MMLPDLFARATDRIVAYVEPLAFLIIWVITFGVMRFLLSPTTRTLGNLMASLFVSVPMGVLAGGIMKEEGFGEFVSTGAACAMSVLAHDIMLTMVDSRKVGRYLDKLVTTLIDRLSK